ncbi:hypothetical protein ABZ746_16025 [Streptomyces sp. NPDC020096]
MPELAFCRWCARSVPTAEFRHGADLIAAMETGNVDLAVRPSRAAVHLGYAGPAAPRCTSGDEYPLVSTYEDGTHPLSAN